FFIAASSFSLHANSQLLKKLGDKVKDKSAQRADQKVDKAIDKTLDKTEEAAKNTGKEDGETTSSGNKKDAGADNGNQAPSMKVYNNYDFVPGDKILFEDQ